MKQLMILITGIIITIGMFSCKKKVNNPNTNEEKVNNIEYSLASNHQDFQESDFFEEVSLSEQDMQEELKGWLNSRGKEKEFICKPRQICVGKKYQIFAVRDIAFDVSILFRSPAGITFGPYPLTIKGGKWQALPKKLKAAGRYQYKYVKTLDGSDISGIWYYQDMTGVKADFDGVTKLYWAFGADGSSWDNRLGWIAGTEDGFANGGNGHNEDTHIIGYNSNGSQYDDYYADDWNKKTLTNSDADNGAEIRSPLDGRIKDKRFSSIYGYLIDVEQKIGKEGQKLVFRVTHLEDIDDVNIGDYVIGGETKLGNISNSGNANGAHAHCVLYEFDNLGSNLRSLNFTFDAYCK